MATITTDTFLDGGVARTAGETWTMNGGILTIRTDTRWHADAPASMTGSIGSTSTSNTLGGGVLIDGRNVREVWFDTGSGTVPAIGTTVTQGGASGYLLGVWASLSSAPTAVGAAMPTTGFIKFREVTGSFAAGVLTGISANATGADAPSWIEVVQRQLAANSVPRLGFFNTRGTWYTLPDVTTGSANQTIQIPTNGGGAGTHVPCVWIETGPGTDVYESYPAIHDTWFLAANLSTDARSKFVQTLGNGQVRIGYDGTANAGYVPPAGCRIRIPNILGRQSTSAGGDANNQVPNATVASRPDFSTTSAGVIDFEYFMNDWYLIFSSANNVMLKNSATFDIVNLSNNAAPCYIDNFVTGAYTGASICLTLTSNFLGGTIQNSKFYRGPASSNGHNCSITTCSDLTFTGCEFGTVQFARSTGRSVNLSQCSNIIFTNQRQSNAYMAFATCFDCTVTNLDHCDRLVGSTDTTTGMYCVAVTASCNRITVDGVTFGLNNTINYCNPYLALFYSQNSSNVTFRNAGTRAAPLPVASPALGPQYAFRDAGVNSNLKVQRIYLEQTRTSPFISVNTTKDLTIESVHGTTGSQQVLAINALVKGIRSDSNSVSVGSSVYGTHYFDMFTTDTTGRLWFAMHEPTASTSSYVTLTLAGSAGGFTSRNQVAMPTLGDQIVIEMPYFALGHTAFQNTAATLTGTNTGNFSYEYDLDLGSGFSGTYQTLDGANLSGETLDPAVGFKMRLRATTTTADTTNALTYVRVDTSSTLAAQTDNLYPLDSAPITITGLRAGSRVQVYDVTNTAELYNAVVAGTSLSFSPTFNANYTARIRVMYATGATADEFIEFSDTVTASGLSRSVTPVVDDVYVANGVDGFSVTGIAIDDTALLIEAQDGTFSWADVYAFETAWLFSEEGIRDEGRFITAVDSANYLLENFKIKNVSSPEAPLILTNGWGRDATTNQTITIIDTTGGSIFSNPDIVISYATGSGLSPTEQATLSKLDTLTEDSSGLRFTTKALETAGGGGLTASDIADAVWDEAISGHLTAGSTGAAVNAASAPSASTVASAVRTELSAELGLLDAAVSSRLAAAGYLAPANSDIASIKAKTDQLPADPASETSVAKTLTTTKFLGLK